MAKNSNTKIHGKGGAIYLGGTFVTANALPTGSIRVASKSEWSLQRNRDYVDDTSFGALNKTYLAGLPNCQGNFSGFLDASGDIMLDSAESGSQNLFLYADDGTVPGGSIRCVAYGPAFIDASVTVSLNDAAKITGEWRASDAWSIVLGDS